jgi:glycerol-3-phosphate responsive antiterminator
VVVALAARVEALPGVIPAAMQWLPGSTEVLG